MLLHTRNNLLIYRCNFCIRPTFAKSIINTVICSFISLCVSPSIRKFPHHHLCGNILRITRTRQIRTISRLSISKCQFHCFSLCTAKCIPCFRCICGQLVSRIKWNTRLNTKCFFSISINNNSSLCSSCTSIRQSIWRSEGILITDQCSIGLVCWSETHGNRIVGCKNCGRNNACHHNQTQKSSQNTLKFAFHKILHILIPAFYYF